MNFMITYQKTNGEVFYRKRKSLMGLRIGETTSMGWLVIDIHEEYEGNYLHHADVMRMIRHQNLYRKSLKKRIARYLISKLNKLT